MLGERDLDVLLSVDPGTWRAEAALIGEYFTTFGRRLPRQLWEEHEALVKRLNAAAFHDPG